MKVKSFRRTCRENKYVPPQLVNMNFKHLEKFEEKEWTPLIYPLMPRF